MGPGPRTRWPRWPALVFDRRRPKGRIFQLAGIGWQKRGSCLTSFGTGIERPAMNRRVRRGIAAPSGRGERSDHYEASALNRKTSEVRPRAGRGACGAFLSKDRLGHIMPCVKCAPRSRGRNRRAPLRKPLPGCVRPRRRLGPRLLPARLLPPPVNGENGSPGGPSVRATVWAGLTTGPIGDPAGRPHRYILRGTRRPGGRETAERVSPPVA
jgi:hypothetical protein